MQTISQTRREFIRFVSTSTVAVSALAWPSLTLSAPGRPRPDKGKPNQPKTAPSELHPLQRSSYGATSATLAHVQEMGINAYLSEQLNWQQIDDSAIENHIQTNLPTSIMDACQLQSQNAYTIWQQHSTARLVRAVHSKRQLYERMVGFWLDHFNINFKSVWYRKVVDENTVIRPHALGNFRDMLHASASSPAMLIYLDNWRSQASGPNENYARELMELHTLGVDGGYSEQDVKEVARCFTGWSLSWGQDNWPCGGDGNGFIFYPQWHDDGDKTVLGHTITSNGVNEGHQVIDILVDHPATATYLATKLCRHFVGDEVSSALVASTAVAFGTDGDISAMLSVILQSDEFNNTTQKIYKRPFEYAAAVLRSLEVAPDDFAHTAMNWMLNSTGHLPYLWPDPDGYPQEKDYWLNSNGHLSRWGKAQYAAFLQGPDGLCHAQRLIGDAVTPEQIVDTLNEKLLFGKLPESQRSALIDYIGFDNFSPTTPLYGYFLYVASIHIAALLMSSAEYQSS